MKKRILAIILSVCMLIGAVPSIVLAAVESGIPRYIDPDTSGDTILSLIEEQTPAVPDGVVTPFGKTGSKTIVERSEFFYHNAFNSSFVHTADESSETKYNIFRALQHLSYPRAVAFDPIGSGKRDHLAVLGLRYNADQTNGTSYLYIFNLENDTLVKTYEFDANWFGWAKDLDITESNNYFAITAGDYDNDGRDSLIIYNSAMRGPNQERALKEIKYNGTSWTDPNKEYIYISVDKLFNTDYMRGNVSGTFIRESNAIRDKLCVSLETGDVDGDGIDDLIVLSSAARISSKFESLHRASIPMLAIARGKEGASSINSLAVSSTRFSTESNGDTYTMAASSVSVGDINLDGKDEIIVAGFNVINGFNNSVLFVEEKNGYQTYSSIRYYVCDFDGKNINNCGGEALSSKDKKASTINSPLNKAQHNIWMQFSNEIVSFDDIDKTPSVFLNGLIYDISYDSDKG